MEAEANDVSVVRITNPLWVGQIAKMVADATAKVENPTVTYETLYAYFCQTVQFGGERAEFWVAFSGKEPIAIAHWYVKGLPYRGVVTCDFIASWNRMADPIGKLADKFIEFGMKHNAPYYEGNATNEALFKVIKKAAGRKGYDLQRTPRIHFLGRKK